MEPFRLTCGTRLQPMLGRFLANQRICEDHEETSFSLRSKTDNGRRERDRQVSSFSESATTAT